MTSLWWALNLWLTGCAQLLSCVRLFATPWTEARQIRLSMGILQARVLQRVAMPSFRESSQPRVFHIAVGFFTIWDTREAQPWLNPYQKWKRHTKTNGQKNCYNAVISLGIQMIFRNNQMKGFFPCSSKVCCCPVTYLYLTLWEPMAEAHHTSHLSLPPGVGSNSYPLLVMPSNHVVLCHPILLQLSIFPSIRVFLNESAVCIRWPKCWCFSFNISPCKEYSGWISFMIDWFERAHCRHLDFETLASRNVKE